MSAKELGAHELPRLVELQLVIYRNERLTVCEGNRCFLHTGTMFLCPPGNGESHQIENMSQFSMCLFFVYPPRISEQSRINCDANLCQRVMSNRKQYVSSSSFVHPRILAVIPHAFNP